MSKSLAFTVVGNDAVAPTISNVAIVNYTMHTVSFSVKSSEIVMLYYVIALAGTDMPVFDDAQDLGPAPYLSTESQYERILLDTPNQIESISIDELVAETSYVIFLYAIDLGMNVVQPKNLTFTTASTIPFSPYINLTP